MENKKQHNNICYYWSIDIINYIYLLKYLPNRKPGSSRKQNKFRVKCCFIITSLVIVLFQFTYRRVLFHLTYRRVLFQFTYRRVFFQLTYRRVLFQLTYRRVFFHLTYRRALIRKGAATMRLHKLQQFKIKN